MIEINTKIKKIKIIGMNIFRKYVSLNLFEVSSSPILFYALDKMSTQCNPALNKSPGESCLPAELRKKVDRAYTKTRKRSRGGGSTNEYKLVKEAPLEPAEKKKLLQAFRPGRPTAWKKNPREWLDSYNIEDVLNQYEEVHPEFEFIGPVPIDFAKDLGGGKCVEDELCKLNLANAYANGTRKIGIVFNLDEHDQPGSHWMCAYIDVPGGGRPGAMYYFDSYGMRPPTRIANFMKLCGRQGCSTLLYNDIRFQWKESECGMYCLYCILCLLNGKSFEEVCGNKINDDTMIAFRKVLYVSEDSKESGIKKVINHVCA